MVVCERDVHDRLDRDRVVAVVVGHDPRPLHERVRPENGRLRLIDHRRAVECAVPARVRDGERAALHVVRQELLVARPCSDVGDRARQPEQVEPLRVADHRNDEPLALGELDGDAEVDEVARDDGVAAHLAVHVGIVLQRVDRGARDEREIRRVDAVGGLVLLLQRLACGDDLRQVDLDRARDVRGGVERSAHVLGDPSPHRGHRLDRLARLRRGSGCRRRLRRLCSGSSGSSGSRRSGRRSRRSCGSRARPLFDERKDVLLRDAAATARARDLVRVDAVLGRDARDHRRDEFPVARRLGGNRLRDRHRCRSRGRSRSFDHRFGRRLRLLHGRCGSGRRAGRAADLRELRPDVDRLPLLHEDLHERPGCGARHLGVHLVRRDLE